MMEIINDIFKFKHCDLDNNQSDLAKFNGFFTVIEIEEIYHEEDYKQVYPSSATIPIMCGLSKIHKLLNPLKPILFAVGSFNHLLPVSMFFFVLAIALFIYLLYFYPSWDRN